MSRILKKKKTNTQRAHRGTVPQVNIKIGNKKKTCSQIPVPKLKAACHAHAHIAEVGIHGLYM